MSSYNQINESSDEETLLEWELPGFFLHDTTSLLPSVLKSSNFSFGRTLFVLRILPKRYSSTTKYNFYISIDNIGICCEKEVELEIGLKKLDGSVKQLHNVRIDIGVGGRHYFGILESMLLEQKHEMAPSGGLTITCTLRRSIKHDMLAKKLKFDSHLKNIKGYCKGSFNVILKVKDKMFDAHRTILMAQSSVFNAMFKHDTLEKQTGVINIPDCDPNAFNMFLEFLYCGRFQGISIFDAFHLFHISDKYDVQDLKLLCVEYIKQCLPIDTVRDVLFADDTDKELLNAAQNFFSQNCEI